MTQAFDHLISQIYTEVPSQSLPVLIYLSHKIITSLKVITEKYLVISNQKCLNFYVQFTIVSKMWYSCTLQVKSNHHFMIECLNRYSWVAHKNRPKTSNKKCYFVLQIICQKKQNQSIKSKETKYTYKTGSGVGHYGPSQFPNL